MRVTDAAVEAAIEEAGWEWQAGPDENGAVIPSPAECMRPILEAAAEHLVDDRIDAALALHHPDDSGLECAHCTSWIPAGPVVRWPCPTALALGVEA